MKIYALILSCFLFCSVFSQTTDELTPGVYLVDNNLNEEIKSPKSMLIVYHGEMYFEVKKKMKKLFRKAKMNVTFTHWDMDKNELANPDIKTSDYEVLCLLLFRSLNRVSDFKDKRQLYHSEWIVVCEKGSNAESLGNATINVYSKPKTDYFHKEVSHMIFSLLTQ